MFIFLEICAMCLWFLNYRSPYLFLLPSAINLSSKNSYFYPNKICLNKLRMTMRSEHVLHQMPQAAFQSPDITHKLGPSESAYRHTAFHLASLPPHNL